MTRRDSDIFKLPCTECRRRCRRRRGRRGGRGPGGPSGIRGLGHCYIAPNLPYHTFQCYYDLAPLQCYIALLYSMLYQNGHVLFRCYISEAFVMCYIPQKRCHCDMATCYIAHVVYIIPAIYYKLEGVIWQPAI